MHSVVGNAFQRAVTRTLLVSNARVYHRAFSTLDSERRDLVRKIRSTSLDEEVCLKELSDACELIPKITKKREFAEILLNRFRIKLRDLDISDTITLLEKIYGVQQIRVIPTITNEIREIAGSLSFRGLSSFSLDDFAAYIELCHTIRANIDSMFVQNMCERIAAVVVESTEEQAQLASYIIRVNRLLSSPTLSERIRTTSPQALHALSLGDLQDILTQISGDEESHAFVVSTRKAAMGILKNRPVSEILTELCSQRLSSSDDIFRAGLSVCEARIDTDNLSSDIACLLLRAWGKQREISEKFSDKQSFERLVSRALEEEDELVRNLHSLARLGSIEIPHEIVVDCIVSRGDHFRPDDLVSIVDSVTLLRLRSPDLIGVLVSNIDAFLCNCDDKDTPLWKFAVWWQSVRNSLPYNSMLVDILKKEFPETVHLLASCPSEEFVQQVRPRTWYAKTIENVANHLKINGIQYELFPRIDYTPLRAHFLARVDGLPCYIILMKSESDIQQVSSDARISVELLKEFAQTNKLKIAFIKSEDLMEPTILDPAALIRRQIDSS